MEEGHEARQQERSADNQVAGEGNEHKSREGFDVHAAHVAHARQLVPRHLPHNQDHDGLDGGDGPRRQVEVAAVGFNGLVTPLLPCSQEPCEGQDNPPEGAGHAKIIQDEKHNSAAGALQTLLDNILDPIVSVTGYSVSPHKESDEVAHRVNTVGHGEEDDRPLGIFESLRVNEESEHSEGAGDKAEDGPDGYPHQGELLVSLTPVHVHLGVAFRGTRLTFLHKVELARIAAGLLAATVLQVQVVAAQRPLWPEVRRLGVGDFGRLVGAVVRRLHAEVVRVVFGWQPGAVQRVRPGEAELLQDGRTFQLDLLTHHSAGRDRVGNLLRAHGSIQRAQEKFEVTVASKLYQRGKLLQLDRCLFLVVVAHEIWHASHVVANVLTLGDVDLLTSPLS